MKDKAIEVRVTDAFKNDDREKRMEVILEILLKMMEGN